MSGEWIKNYLPLAIVAASIVGFAYLLDHRVATIEQELKAADVKHLSRQVTSLKCDVKNLKKLLQQKPEVDCDD